MKMFKRLRVPSPARETHLDMPLPAIFSLTRSPRYDSTYQRTQNALRTIAIAQRRICIQNISPLLSLSILIVLEQ